VIAQNVGDEIERCVERNEVSNVVASVGGLIMVSMNKPCFVPPRRSRAKRVVAAQNEAIGSRGFVSMPACRAGNPSSRPGSATDLWPACCRERASPSLGLDRRKFYSCAAIEKKYFTLCGRT
jgi:hypothetical protein